MDVEAIVAAYLAETLGVPAYQNVPAERPDEFIVVQRTGGALENVVIGTPMLAVRTWAPTRPACWSLTERVREALLDMVGEVANVVSVFLSSTFRDVDLDTGLPRYQVTAQLQINE